ncbi:hypothetical protein ACIRO1_17285 [Streptomyces sp. NPDC102381]|uniref:hypothetical protein n=1 Tax=Streptomyces sp. NPDC102381 TaxID=3366164 RepID=UPI0037FFFA98
MAHTAEIVPAAVAAERPQVDAYEALGRIHEAQRTASPQLAEILQIMAEAILDGADPTDVGEQVLGLVAEARAERSAHKVHA